MNHASFLACVTIALAAGGSVQAADTAYPSKPIQLVIPFPPGGATDVVGRLIGKALGDRLGQPVVVENRAGAGTIIGAGYVAKAAPDGYTLLISSGTTFTVNPAIQPKLPYDPVKSFEPIGLVGTHVPLILLGQHATCRSNNLKQFVALRARPRRTSTAYALVRQRHHRAVRRRAAAARHRHSSWCTCPYKGSAPAMTDLIGGPDAVLDRHRRGRHPAAQDRQDQGHRRHRRQALGAAARRADGGRKRLSRLRRRHLAGAWSRRAACLPRSGPAAKGAGRRRWPTPRCASKLVAQRPASRPTSRCARR